VEETWISCGRPDSGSFFRIDHRLKSTMLHIVDAPSMVLSLDCRLVNARLLPAPCSTFITAAHIVNLHRFEEIINGREYRIEVSNVGSGKWRAQLARLPGGSVATMPFYGTTPKEAAGQLSQWLTLAHAHTRPRL
jgi:hypothetical protein